jgi:hypothetical protein
MLVRGMFPIPDHFIEKKTKLGSQVISIHGSNRLAYQNNTRVREKKPFLGAWRAGQSYFKSLPDLL